MQKDTFLISAVVGVAATALEIILTFILKLTGLIKTPLYLFVGKLAVGQVPKQPQWIEPTVGIIGHLIIGVTFTFLFVLVLRKWGDDYIYLKGLGFGGFLWVIHEVIIPNIITSKIVLRISAVSQLTHIITAFFWGLAAAFIYRLLQKRIKFIRF